MLREEPGAVLIDVRSAMEHEYVGHPVGAINIPWRELPDWSVDSNFALKVTQLLESRQETVAGDKSQPLLLICRSGQRSQDAGEELLRQGFTNVYNIIEGFEGRRDEEKHRSTINGWRCRKLPWEQA